MNNFMLIRRHKHSFLLARALMGTYSTFPELARPATAASPTSFVRSLNDFDFAARIRLVW